MVDEVVDVAGLEFVQDGHRDGAVGEGREEADAPVGLVAGADGDLVAPFQAALLEGDVQFFDPPGDVAVFEGDARVVGQGGAVPVGAETLLEEAVDGGVFHFVASFVGAKYIFILGLCKFCGVFV